MIVYATVTDLTGWLAELNLTAPANADGLLRSATMTIAQAANRNPYDDAPTGLAVDVLRDATCAQATAWITLGVAPAAVGLDVEQVKSKKLGSGDITYETTGQATARAEAAAGLAPEAEKILYAGGLLALTVPVGASDTDDLIDFTGNGIATNPTAWPSSLWTNL